MASLILKFPFIQISLTIITGGVTLPTSLAGRTIISSWWIFCIVSIAVYSGNLTAAFTVNKQRLPFTNLEEMVKQKEYKWGLLGNSVYETVFKVPVEI